jgi:hypothetical protein
MRAFLTDARPTQLKRKARCNDAQGEVPAPKRFAMGLVSNLLPPPIHTFPDGLPDVGCPELQNSDKRKRKAVDELIMPVSKTMKISGEEEMTIGQPNDMEGLPTLNIASGATLSVVTSLRSHLLDLPVEIIYEIGTHADSATVHNLTAVCHFLADCLIPLFFKRQDFQAPSADNAYPKISASTIQHFTALQVWRRSSLFRPLKYAIFSLRPEDAGRQAELLRKFFESLQGEVFTQLLIIYIHSLPYFHSQPAAIFTILQSIVGCKSLSVDASSCHTISIEGIPTVEVRQGNVCQVAAQIHSFTASTPLLFSPYLLPWTFALFAHAKLHELDLQNILLLPEHWANLLPQINIPTLTKVCIPVDVPPSSVTHFVLRHQCLNSLVVGGDSDLGCTDYSGLGELCLPHLQELRGPLNVVKSFLNAMEAPLTITHLAIELYPVGTLTAELLQDILNHPSCAILPRLTLAFGEPEDTLILKHLNLGFTGSPVQELIITYRQSPFAFTEMTLVNTILLFHTIIA